MSYTNPFSPPAEPFGEFPETERVYSHVGVFQEDGMLVLSRSRCQLPPVCMKTGEQTSDCFSLNENALPASRKVGIALFGGLIGLAIAKSIWGEQFNLNIPMRSDWVDPAAAKSKRGWVVGGMGAPLFWSVWL